MVFMFKKFRKELFLLFVLFIDYKQINSAHNLNFNSSLIIFVCYARSLFKWTVIAVFCYWSKDLLRYVFNMVNHAYLTVPTNGRGVHLVPIRKENKMYNKRKYRQFSSLFPYSKKPFYLASKSGSASDLWPFKISIYQYMIGNFLIVTYCRPFCRHIYWKSEMCIQSTCRVR